METRSAIGYIERATPRLTHLHVAEELYNIFDYRNALEDVWVQLSKKQRAIARAFDRVLLSDTDRILAEEFPWMREFRERNAVPRRYWWYYLDEIKAGTMQLPADLKGAA